nr:lipopolysaccharide heptosyltransferase I [Rickettsiella massiliensis]
MRILIIKMSSMGDLLHTLPAVSDARAAIPNIRFDWVAEEAFTEIPRWHPQVDHVIPIGLRRWRRQSTWNASCKEIRDFIKNLRHRHYDGMIDAQSSIKSAIVTRLAHGPRYGMDKRSVREVGAQWAYQKKCFIPKAQHAILRIRQLFAQALGYPLPDTEPQYGIDPNQLPICPIALPKQYLILIPNASREDKCWPEENWSTLINAYTGAWPLLIPWGNANEKARAVRLSALDSRVIVLPKLHRTSTYLAECTLYCRCRHRTQPFSRSARYSGYHFVWKDQPTTDWDTGSKSTTYFLCLKSQSYPNKRIFTVPSRTSAPNCVK